MPKIKQKDVLYARRLDIFTKFLVESELSGSIWGTNMTEVAHDTPRKYAVNGVVFKYCTTAEHHFNTLVSGISEFTHQHHLEHEIKVEQSPEDEIKGRVTVWVRIRAEETP